MAIAMSLGMSLVQTIATLGFASNFVSVWLISFARGSRVPTATLVAPRAQRLAELIEAAVSKGGKAHAGCMR